MSRYILIWFIWNNSEQLFIICLFSKTLKKQPKTCYLVLKLKAPDICIVKKLFYFRSFLIPRDFSASFLQSLLKRIIQLPGIKLLVNQIISPWTFLHGKFFCQARKHHSPTAVPELLEQSSILIALVLISGQNSSQW